MTRVLRGDNNGELEPTPGAGPCLHEVFPQLRDDAEELYSEVANKEYNYVDALLYRSDKVQAYARCFVSLECLRLMYVIVELCGPDTTLEPFQWPEVDKALIREGCLALMARPWPELKAKNLLRRSGVPEPSEIAGYRPATDEEVEMLEQQ